MAEMDRDRFYQAMLARDPRFDGRFFVGVRTTGVYCRSICPAPNPKRGNCLFFASAAAAQAAGFRPCKRCRPETAPHSPAWSGTEATVRRGLKLIADGVLDGGSVAALAARLGVGDRHLRRLFDVHLGASPAAVAQTQRLHLAKQLLERTDLSMADVALAAGYGSLRRFNAAVRSVYDAPPAACAPAPAAAAPKGQPPWN
jgi:AraC family transcriptional regulator of adaptative response / DNA-3-methyladenine glycosylase II